MKKILNLIMAFTVVLVLNTTAFAEDIQRTKAPEGAEVYIISPKDGDIVDSKFLVQFGLKNMGVAPAGHGIENTGHHHLIVDGELPNFNYAIADENIIHFGGGQTETTLELEPGKHSLQLILGDENHVPHDPAIYSKKITVTVK